MNLRNQPAARTWLAAGITLAALALPVASHAVQMTYELRAVQVGVLPGDQTSSGVDITNGGHSVNATQANSVIVLQLFAVLNNLNGNNADDGFTGGIGSFLGTGPLAGTLRGDVGPLVAGNVTQRNNVPGANAGTAQSGFMADLNGDATLDVGDITSFGSSPTVSPWFTAVGGTGTGGTTFGSGASTNATEILIGETTFTLAPGAAPQTLSSINFKIREYSNGILTARKINKYVIDGVSQSVVYNDANLGLGAAVNIGYLIPEPSALGMVLLGSLGLVGFRRSAFRRQSA